MRTSSIFLLLITACTGRIHPVATSVTETYQAVSGGVTVDASAFSFVPSGGSEVTQKSVAITTTGPDLLVAIGEMQHPGVSESISDSAGLSWQQVGTWTQDESDVGEGSETLTMFAARAPGALTSTVTVRFGVSAGAGLGVLALASAGTPVNFTHGSDPTFAAPAFAMNPQPGSILFGGGVDVSGDCCFAWTAMANTALRGGVGLYSNDYGVFWASAPGGSETFGTTRAISGFVDWGGIAVEIPFSPPADGGTPPPSDGGTPGDAGTPDAGTCSWVCQ